MARTKAGLGPGVRLADYVQLLRREQPLSGAVPPKAAEKAGKVVRRGRPSRCG